MATGAVPGSPTGSMPPLPPSPGRVVVVVAVVVVVVVVVVDPPVVLSPASSSPQAESSRSSVAASDACRSSCGDAQRLEVVALLVELGDDLGEGFDGLGPVAAAVVEEDDVTAAGLGGAVDDRGDAGP